MLQALQQHVKDASTQSADVVDALYGFCVDMVNERQNDMYVLAKSMEWLDPSAAEHASCFALAAELVRGMFSACDIALATQGH